MSKRVALHRGIRAIRTIKGLSQGSLASAVFISSPHLTNIEAGRRGVSEELIALLANALDVEVDAISYVTSDATSA